MKRILDADPLTGVTVTMNMGNDGTFSVTHEQDVSAVLDYNKALANDTDATRKGMRKGLWHYAKIPAVVQMEWLHKHGVDIGNKDHSKAMFRLLNDPQYRYLKTTTKTHTPR